MVPTANNPQRSAIAGFVTGLIGLGTCQLPLLWVPFTVAGLYLSVVGVNSSKRVLAILGIGLSVAAILLGIGNGVREILLTLPEALKNIHGGY
jgi:uncharacterized membrane protein